MMRRCYAICAFLLLAADLSAGIDDNLIAGKKVEADTKLQKGDRLVAHYEKKNYVVEVLDVKANKLLRIQWVSTREVTDDVQRTELYYAGDATPTRKVKKSPLPEAYQKFDKNGDGQVALSEWDRAKFAEFKKLDKNRDGFLTPQELTVRTLLVAGATNATTMKDGESKDPNGSEEIPAPANLLGYEEKIDESFTFNVTGKATGGVWGTSIYAVESDLAAAAVHAGAVKDGATGQVKVTILASVSKFTGSAANGVTSVERQEAGPAFKVEAVVAK